MRIRRQHDLQEHRRWIGRGAGVIIPEPGIERRQIYELVQQMLDRMLEGAGEELPTQIHRQELGLGV
ncbi:MAG TPA: hypothetical protein VF970_02630, partial [Gemmatimonadales bacterium]